MITPEAIAATVEAGAADYERCMRRRGFSETEIQDDLKLFLEHVTAAFVCAAAELDEWLRVGRWLQ